MDHSIPVTKHVTVGLLECRCVNQCASLELCTGVSHFVRIGAAVKVSRTSKVRLHSCLTSALDGLSAQLHTSTVLIPVTTLLLPAAYEIARV